MKDSVPGSGIALCIPSLVGQRYNGAVSAPAPEKSADHIHHRHRVYAMETTGLLIIGVLLLVLILIRYWSAFHQLFR